jgi:hypothetical protein
VATASTFAFLSSSVPCALLAPFSLAPYFSNQHSAFSLAVYSTVTLFARFLG